MLGFIMSAIAGAAMSFQGVINTRLSDKIGLWESNVFAQGTAFILSLIVMLIWGKGSFSALGGTEKVYWLGGVLGLIITVTVMLSVKGLGPTAAVSVILITQLLTAALIDAFGLLGSEKLPFGWNKYVALGLMAGGMLLFKWK
ncbi:MAG: DMT family transporter [Oscillospiraceae bacterium]|nr:DMT family transporter [Oscillospiraceae bacterium]